MQLIEYLRADRLLVEDKEARQYAEALGIPCVGTPGVLELAKRRGLIPAIRPLFEELLAHRRFFAIPVLNKILSANNESPL